MLSVDVFEEPDKDRLYLRIDQKKHSVDEFFCCFYAMHRYHPICFLLEERSAFGEERDETRNDHVRRIQIERRARHEANKLRCSHVG